MSKRACTICCAHLKSEATVGSPDAVWMTPTLMVPLLTPGPLHVAGDPPAVVAEPPAVVALAAAVVALAAAVVVDDLLLLLLQAARTAAAAAQTTSTGLPRWN